MKEAGPSTPVQVTGFTGLPQAGDLFVVLKSERDTREISLKRQQIKREQEYRRVHHLTLDEISRRIKTGGVKELGLIIKGDVDGSVEAINDSLVKLSNDEVTVKVIRKGVGAISESDVLLASASNAIILGFQVRPTVKAREIAKKENVDIRLYRVIYDAIADVRAALEGMLEPDYEEENLSTIEVREIFKVPKVGTVAGCYVVSGKVNRKDNVRLYRDDKLLYEGKISSLKRFKEDVKEVAAGFECGIGLENFDDIKVGDVLETYTLKEVKKKLVTN
jgi:translation initiation factor IF-2